MALQLQRGQLITLELERMVPKNVAFGRFSDGRPVFVTGGAPGELVEVALTKIKKDFLEARFVRAIRLSADRVEPPFSQPALAGADWAYLSYQAQLTAKTGIVHDLLQRVGKLPDPKIERIVPAAELWRYRNKVELTFGLDAKAEVALGFHKPGQFDQILPTADSALFPEVIQTIIASVTNWARSENISVYDARRHTGLLRNLVVRRAANGSDLLLNLVTSPGEIPLSSFLFPLKSLPLSGVVHSQNSSDATIVRVDEMQVLTGGPTITETFLGTPITYQVDSFFQTNTQMAELLAQAVLKIIAEIDPETVIDGYAGVGGFGLFAAADGRQVISIESHQPSSIDAFTNATRLGVADKMTFVNQPMETYLLDLRSPITDHRSLLIVDPPRSGLHPKALKAIAESGPRHVIYVSCGPATLARDLDLLRTSYQPMLIQPFDLFPQTSHVETLVHLTRAE